MNNEASSIKFNQWVNNIDPSDEDDSENSLGIFRSAIELRIYFKKSGIPDSDLRNLWILYLKRNLWIPFTEEVYQLKAIGRFWGVGLR